MSSDEESERLSVDCARRNRRIKKTVVKDPALFDVDQVGGLYSAAKSRSMDFKVEKVKPVDAVSFISRKSTPSRDDSSSGVGSDITPDHGNPPSAVLSRVAETTRVNQEEEEESAALKRIRQDARESALHQPGLLTDIRRTMSELAGSESLNNSSLPLDVSPSLPSSQSGSRDEDQPIKLFVRYRGTRCTVTARRSQTLEQVLLKANRELTFVCEPRVYGRSDEDLLPLESHRLSLAELGFSFGDVLDCTCISAGGGPGGGGFGQLPLLIQIDEKRRVKHYVNPDKPVGEALRAFLAAEQLPPGASFRLDGEPVDHAKTPAQLGIEADEIIDVFLPTSSLRSPDCC